MTRRHRIGLGVSTIAMIVAAPSFAQTSPLPAPDAQGSTAAGDNTAVADGQAADIIVTGSRIARQDYVAQSPIATTTPDAVENAGVPTIDSYLVQLPQFQPGTGGFSNASGGGLGVGQATLNLRGLGSVRTLVLLDGRRLQPGNAQSVIDINTIPVSAIGGVEVITGGASATYGSDAIAGVVNFKLRRTFDGVELRAQMGISERGDAPTRQFAGIAGTSFADGRGKVMVAAEYADRAAIAFRDRAFSTPTGNLAGQTEAGYYAPTGSNLPTQAAVNALFGTYGVAAGAVPRTVNFGVNFDRTLFRSGTPGTNYRDYGDPCIVNNGAAGFGYDGQCTNNLQNALERVATLARAEYAVTPDVTLFLQGQFARSMAKGQGSHPQAIPFGAAGLFVPITNPFIPADLRTILASRPNPTDSFVYVKRITEAGPRAFASDTNTYQVLGGAEGKFGASGWTWEAYASHGNTYAVDRTVSGAISNSAIQTLLNAPGGGTGLCEGGYNIFGPARSSTSCLAYITRATRTTTSIDQDEAAVNVSGGLFRLPAGEVKVAFSGNYRDTRYATDPDPLIQSGDIAAFVAVQPTRGSINVLEGAVEVLVPLLHDLPLIQSLNVVGGYRYSDYNVSGGVSTWKANFDWRVFEPLMLRGGYQKAVRAPNIGELFLPKGGTIANIGSPPAAGDPCDVRSAFRTGSAAGQVRALCLAQGIPSTIIDTYNQNNVGVASSTQGNRDLQPETARSWTIGGVFQPKGWGSLIDRLSLSVDYYNIRIAGTIATLGVQTTFSKCFNADGSNPSYSVANYYCSIIARSPLNGQVSEAQQPLLNLGGYRTDGIDTQLDWSLPFDTFGGSARERIDLNLTANYLNSFQVQQLPGSPFQEFRGTIGGTEAYARWKVAGSLAVGSDAFQVGTRWRHLTSFRDVSIVTNPASTIAGVPAVDYFDIFARVRADDAFEFRLGVTNVGDRQPPQVGALRGFTNQGNYDVIGRAYYVGAQAKF